MPEDTRTLEPAQSEELDRRLRLAVEELDGLELALDELREAALAVARKRKAEAPQRGLLELTPPFLADFCLAHACRRTPPLERGWRFVVERFSRELFAVARECGDGAPEEVVGSFFGELWIVRPGRRSLLDTYMGLGPLRAWLVLVFRRQLVRAARGAGACAPLPPAQASPAPAPEELVLRAELLATLRPLLSSALETLSERDRELLEARLVRRERGVDTARRFGVSPAYVSRRFQEVLRELRARLLAPLALKGFDAEDAL